MANSIPLGRCPMKKVVLCAVLLLAAAGAASAKNDNHPGDNGGKSPGLPVILSFDTMYGVDGPLLGETNAIRGVIGDEAPWAIAQFIQGRLDTSGRLQILVRGLVFKDDPLVDPGLVGKDDE